MAAAQSEDHSSFYVGSNCWGEDLDGQPTMTRLATLVWHLYLVNDPVTVQGAAREMGSAIRCHA